MTFHDSEACCHLLPCYSKDSPQISKIDNPWESSETQNLRLKNLYFHNITQVIREACDPLSHYELTSPHQESGVAGSQFTLTDSFGRFYIYQLSVLAH